jgi:MFS family permease
MPTDVPSEENTPASPRDRLVQRYRAGAERLKPKRFREFSLDALNFLVADVRGGLGPYVTVYLAADRNWALGDIGLVTTLGGYLGLAAQTPLGWIIDHTPHKRGLLIIALAVLGAGATAIALFPSFWPVLIANAFMQVVSGVFEPAIAALTVGLFTREALTRRMGRNAAYSRAGNIVIAAMSAGVAWLFSPRAVFLQVPATVLVTMIAAYSIPYGAIDQRRARGLRSGEGETGGPAGWKVLVQCRPLLVFGICSLLYELADAPLLTIVGQQLGLQYKGWGIVLTSGLIIAAQIGMLGASLVVGRKADEWGHRWLLVAGFALLPVQAALTWLWSAPAWLIGVQVLGGVGTGLFAALTPLLLADLMQGTGRYNLSQGVMATLRGIGVTSSGLVSELVVSRSGYDAVFLSCGVVGLLALALLWWAMPETSAVPRPNRPGSGGDRPSRQGPKPVPEADEPVAGAPAAQAAPG